ncbi:hypothetical protein PG985_011094 [Apiospora marii]|uniref:uncharacterized protein n=1 Tax=Apiospora marii TaxID=335849 RepID=UPI00312D1EEB
METRDEKLATWAIPPVGRQHDLRFLECSIRLEPDSPNTCPKLHESKLQFHEVGDHLLQEAGITEDDDQSSRWHFKVLSLPRIFPGNLVLSVPRTLFRQIQDAWHLHPRTIEAFLSNNGIFATAHCRASGRSSAVWKAANSPSGFDCVSVTRNPASRTTYVLYHHLADEAGVFRALLGAPPWHSGCRLLDHYFFVAALYHVHHQQVEAHRGAIDHAILATEQQTHFGTPGILMDSLRGLPRLDDQLPAAPEDTKETIQRLSYCQTDLAVIGHVARADLDCGEQLIRAIDEDMRELSLPRSKDDGPSDHGSRLLVDKLGAAMAMTRDDVEFTRRRTATLLSQVQQMKDRSQSQTSFMLSAIAQREAEYTAAIAIDTKRDSVAMRTIAVLGIVFLPGTFIATLFSVDMFEWGSAAGGADASDGGATGLRASPSMWVYWAITVPLTTLTFLAWFLWSKRENQKSDQRLMIGHAKPLGPSLGASVTAAALRYVGLGGGEKSA